MKMKLIKSYRTCISNRSTRLNIQTTGILQCQKVSKLKRWHLETIGLLFAQMLSTLECSHWRDNKSTSSNKHRKSWRWQDMRTCSSLFIIQVCLFMITNKWTAKLSIRTPTPPCMTANALWALPVILPGSVSARKVCLPPWTPMD